MNAAVLKNHIEAFSSKQILVIGDAMIDTYLFGEIHRLSPEAPVPIVDVNSVEHKAGGAANVALNIKSLGATAHLLSITGKDALHDVLHKILETQEIQHYLVQDTTRPTTQKNRIYNKDEYVLRYDSETTQDISSEIELDVMNQLHRITNAVQIDAVILQDYNKGMLTASLIEQIISFCEAKNIPTAIDPKKKHFFEYKNATLFKPNFKETKEALNIQIENGNLEAVQNAASTLLEKLHCKKVMITLSEHGVFGFSETEKIHLAAHLRNIKDVSGAGDSVIATAALCLASNTSFEELLYLSNLAGGLVCEKVGVHAITQAELVAGL